MIRRHRVMWSAIAVGVLVAMTLTLTAAIQAAERGSAAAVPQLRRAPILAGPTLAGGSADLADLRGHVVIVTVWASWCPPCRAELPILAQTERSYADAGVEFLGILTRDTPASAGSLLAQTQTSGLTSVLDPDGTTAVTWGATGVPETYVVDGSGSIRARQIGAVTLPWLMQQIDPLIGG